MSKRLDIVYKVCTEYFGEFNKKLKDNDMIYKRGVYFQIAKELTTDSLKAIGGKVGRNHATVIHSLNNSWWMRENEFMKAYEVCKDIATACLNIPEAKTTKQSWLIHKTIELKEKIRELENKDNGLDEMQTKALELFDQLSMGDKADAIYKLETMVKVRNKLKERYANHN